MWLVVRSSFIGIIVFPILLALTVVLIVGACHRSAARNSLEEKTLAGKSHGDGLTPGAPQTTNYPTNDNPVPIQSTIPVASQPHGAAPPRLLNPATAQTPSDHQQDEVILYDPTLGSPQTRHRHTTRSMDNLEQGQSRSGRQRVYSSQRSPSSSSESSFASFASAYDRATSPHHRVRTESQNSARGNRPRKFSQESSSGSGQGSDASVISFQSFSSFESFSSLEEED